MQIAQRPANKESLRLYGTVPVAFEVHSILEPHLIVGGAGGIELRQVGLPEPYVKDYDALPGGHPESWLSQFNLDGWGIFLVEDQDRILAGAAVAPESRDLLSLKENQSQALLWDIRVHPDVRRQGIGAKLIHKAFNWARSGGCASIAAETQNTNLPACRFYARHGFELRSIDRFAYAAHQQVAHEILLLWQKTLI